MKNTSLEKVERIVSIDRKGILTLVSLGSTIGIYINLTRLSSPYLGVTFSVIYFLINSVFTGNIFFRDEVVSFRCIFGLLLLVMLIALGGTTIIVASALISIKFDAITTTALLASITATLSFLKHTRIMTRLLNEKWEG